METTKEKINRVCPITGLDFFMSIENESGVLVDTYGGPFDSYTTPTNDGDDWVWERYCHDRGVWMGFESVPDCHIIDYLKEQTTSQQQTIERLRELLQKSSNILERHYQVLDLDGSIFTDELLQLLNTTEPTNK